jgi:hypothetical protein
MDKLDTTSPGTLTRRRLVQAGAGGTAVLGFGGLGALEGVAGAAFAGASSEGLRRSSWLGLESDEFRVKDAGEASLRLVAVEDLPVAASRPELVGSEDAFCVVLRGPQGLPGEILTLENDDLGEVTVFVSPVGDGNRQEYGVIVDRTVRLPGDNAASGGSGSGGPPGGAPAPSLRCVAARLRRGRGRTLVAEATLSGQAELVRAALLRRGRAVARAIATPEGTAVKLRLRPRAEAEPGRYLLRLELIDAAGNEATARARVRLR